MCLFFCVESKTEIKYMAFYKKKTMSHFPATPGVFKNTSKMLPLTY